MSEQTKQQAIGYMTQALFEAGADQETLKLFFIRANERLATNAILNNSITMDYLEGFILAAVKITDESGGAINHVKEAFIKNAKSALYWLHDEKTVEQAGDFYNAWLIIFSLYRRLERAEFSELWKWGESNQYKKGGGSI